MTVEKIIEELKKFPPLYEVNFKTTWGLDRDCDPRKFSIDDGDKHVTVTLLPYDGGCID